MEVLSPSQDELAATFTDRGESFVARRPTRVKRATLLQGRDVQDVPAVFRFQFLSIFSLSSSSVDCDPDSAHPDPSDTQAVECMNSAQSAQGPTSTSREDACSADNGTGGRIASSEDQIRAVGSDGTSSLTVQQSSDQQSSLREGPSSQYTPASGDLSSPDASPDAVATEDEAGVGGDQEGSSRGQGSADDRQYVMEDSGRSLHVDAWSDTQQAQDSLSAQRHLQSSEDVLEADDRPLISNEAAGDENEASEDDDREAAEVDQENINPDNMPLSSLFKTTKGKKNKSKKGKGKDATETNVANDATSPKEAQADEQTPTAASPQASDVSGTSPSDDVKKTEEEKMADKVEGLQEKKKEENDVGSEQIHANSSDAKTDVTSGPQDSAAVLYTTESRDVTLAAGEGPQLSPSEGGKMEGEGGVVDMQPAKADGSLPPETPGREKQSLLHDHNPEGMVCCTIL